VSGVLQPSPAPRFSRTPGAIKGPPPERGANGYGALIDWGFDDNDIERLSALGLGFASEP
jgi:alpha-methylacyl-CoA racemase